MRCNISELYMDFSERTLKDDAEDRMPHLGLGFKFLRLKNPNRGPG